MGELKTRQNDSDVDAFISRVGDTQKQQDCFALVDLMQSVTGCPPKMWGTSIVGFGSYHYVYASGREGDWMITGFSPRKQNLAIYIMPGFSNYAQLMDTLGKHKTGKSCLYVKTLDDLDSTVLRRLVSDSVEEMRQKYECG